MSDNTLVNVSATDATATTENQATSQKTYTQEEFDRHMAGLKQSLTKKLLKPYEELGDVEELRALREQANKLQQEQSLKRGEFDKVIHDLASKKDAEIQKRDQIIQGYKVDMPLVEAASRYRAVAPDQVKALLKDKVRLNNEGEVEVLDATGSPRYSDAGKLLSVDEYVKEFLDSNRHFVQATPATSATKTSINSPGSLNVDVTKLDMKNPAHRKLYAEAKSKAKT